MNKEKTQDILSFVFFIVSKTDNYQEMVEELDKQQDNLNKANEKSIKLDNNSIEVKDIVENTKNSFGSKDKYVLTKDDKDKILNYIDNVNDTNNDYKNMKRLSNTLNNVDKELKENRDIINTLYIYKQLSSEDDSANKFLFLTFYETIETSLVYRIVIGLSRLFDSNSSARTLRKVLNVLQQTRIVNGSKEINMALSEVLLDDSNVRDTYNFKNLRDKYFAHLDKEMVFSSLVIFKEIEKLNKFITINF